MVTYASWRFEVLYDFIHQEKNKKIALRLEAMLAKDLANKVEQKRKKQKSCPSP